MQFGYTYVWLLEEDERVSITISKQLKLQCETGIGLSRIMCHMVDDQSVSYLNYRLIYTA